MTGRYPFRYGLQTAVIPRRTPMVCLPMNAVASSTSESWLHDRDHRQVAFRPRRQKYWPRQRGFDHQYGPLIGEIDYFTHEQHHVLDWYSNNEPLKEEGYSTELIGKEAVRYIEQHTATNKPLYMYLTFNAPHNSYQAPQEYLDKYKHIEEPRAVEPIQAWSTPWMTKSGR